jgi:hypothetical protein
MKKGIADALTNETARPAADLKTNGMTSESGDTCSQDFNKGLRAPNEATLASLTDETARLQAEMERMIAWATKDFQFYEQVITYKETQAANMGLRAASKGGSVG